MVFTYVAIYILISSPPGATPPDQIYLTSLCNPSFSDHVLPRTVSRI